jgi:DNA-binding NtrC family response regulator
VKVLLVDDDKSTLTLLGLHLARAGLEVSGALDAAGACARLEGESFDWLVVDGQIGADDGFRLAEEAKRRRPELRVAMISGYYDRNDARGAIEKLFPKPVDTDALLAHLRSERPS